jgi:hypothetical protein
VSAALCGMQARFEPTEGSFALLLCAQDLVPPARGKVRLLRLIESFIFDFSFCVAN